MSAADEIRGLLCALIISCGLTLALLCGTCSGTFGFIAVVQAIANKSYAPIFEIWPFLLAGVVAMVAGIAVIAVGVRLSGAPTASSPNDEREGQ